METSANTEECEKLSFEKAKASIGTDTASSFGTDENTTAPGTGLSEKAPTCGQVDNGRKRKVEPEGDLVKEGSSYRGDTPSKERTLAKERFSGGEEGSLKKRKLEAENVLEEKGAGDDEGISRKRGLEPDGFPEDEPSPGDGTQKKRKIEFEDVPEKQKALPSPLSPGDSGRLQEAARPVPTRSGSYHGARSLEQAVLPRAVRPRSPRRGIEGTVLRRIARLTKPELIWYLNAGGGTRSKEQRSTAAASAATAAATTLTKRAPKIYLRKRFPRSAVFVTPLPDGARNKRTPDGCVSFRLHLQLQVPWCCAWRRSEAACTLLVGAYLGEVAGCPASIILADSGIRTMSNLIHARPALDNAEASFHTQIKFKAQPYPTSENSRRASEKVDDYEHVAKYMKNTQVKLPLGTLSKSEWEATSIYVVFAFEKQQ
ncbi:PREDICTED: mRNA cap guanine-N7 methyltransferase [Condylura cristata]|uniref:mRNA cap guanine-N7 methyltransferase n=1 Tax=Condylura cristata TaxID=143302 RepID=UPI000642A68F|nr:PREDICTED: mRNA cap guanine-N7 methyltransferase [Condylura cristata]